MFGKANDCVISFNRLVASCEAPHIEKESFETVRFVMLMKARLNSPTHMIVVVLSLSPTREMLLAF